MAVKLVTKTVTIPAGGSITLTQILGASDPRWIHTVTMRAKGTNAGNIEWSDGDGESGGFLDALEASTLDWGEGGALSSDLIITGTANDVVYMSIDVNRYYSDQGL